MNGRNMLIGAASAVGAFAITLAILAPANLNATGPVRRASAFAALSDSPLVVDGVEIKLLHSGSKEPVEMITLKPDAPLKFKLVARNTSGDSADLEAEIVISQQAIASRMSRVMSIPTVVWQGTRSISLAAGDTSTFELSPDIKTQSGTTLIATVSFGEHGGRSLSFSIPSQNGEIPLRNER